MGRLTNLTDLSLHDTGIGDAGLEHLEGLPDLEELDIDGTHVTPEGVEKLQEVLPDCEIFYRPSLALPRRLDWQREGGAG